MRVLKKFLQQLYVVSSKLQLISLRKGGKNVQKEKHQIIATTLCIALTISRSAVVVSADTTTDFVAEKEKVVLFESLSNLQVVPTDFSTISKKGKKIIVHIHPEIDGEVDGDMVADLIENNNLESGDRININHIGYPEPPNTPAPLVDFNNYYNTTYRYASVRETHDKFVSSVAKGATKTLQSAWTYTVSGGFEGAISLHEIVSVTAKLSGAITGTFSTKYVFKGPPENSRYNSREYRVRYYKQRVKVTQTDPITSIKKSSTYDKAVKYADYSIDSKVS